jgi:hypothetical protein
MTNNEKLKAFEGEIERRKLHFMLFSPEILLIGLAITIALIILN